MQLPAGVLVQDLGFSYRIHWGVPKPYLDPEEPTFSGFLIMISLHKLVLKKGRFFRGSR